MMDSSKKPLQRESEATERSPKNLRKSGSKTIKQPQNLYAFISKQNDRICPKFACLLKNLKHFWPPGANTDGILHHEWVYLQKNGAYYISKMKGKNFSRRKHSSINAVAILEACFSQSSFLNHESMKSLQRKTGLSRLFVSSWFKWKRKQLGIKCPSTFLQSVYIKEQFPSDLQKSDISAMCGLNRRTVDSWFRVTRALDNNFVVGRIDPEEIIMWRLFMRNHHRGGICDSDVDLMSDILDMPKVDVYKIFLCWCQRFEVENRMNPNTISLCRVAEERHQASSSSCVEHSLCDLEIQTCEDEPLCSKVKDILENKNGSRLTLDEVAEQPSLPKIKSVISLSSSTDINNNTTCIRPENDTCIKTMPLVNSLLKESTKKMVSTPVSSDDKVAYAMSVMNNALTHATEQLIPTQELDSGPRIDFSDHTIVESTLLDIRSKQTSKGIPSKIQVLKKRRKKLKYQNLKCHDKISPLYFKTKKGNTFAPCKSYTEESRKRIRRKKMTSKSDDDIIFVRSYNKNNVKSVGTIHSDSSEDSENDTAFLESLSKVCQRDYEMQTRKMFRYEIQKQTVDKQMNSDAIHDIYHQFLDENNPPDGK